MILTEIFSPAPEIYLPFPLPASDCLYQPFSQNISRLKFILLPALNLYGVMSQNYLPSACQFFTFHQTRYIAIAVRSQHLTCAITDKVAPCRSKVGIRSKLQRFVVFVSKQTRNLISPFDKPIAHRYYAPRSHDSSVVQSVERRTVNPYVTGSSPVRGDRF